ncbi:MAG: histidine kinase [Verrucomicrobia bacterium]|nr:histidine kinase [Verrucomicrobiota bacterium]
MLQSKPNQTGASTKRLLLAGALLWFIPLTLTTALLAVVGSLKFTTALTLALYLWIVWALFSPLVVWLAFRFPLRRKGLVINVTIHLATWATIVWSNQTLALHLEAMPSPRFASTPPPWRLQTAPRENSERLPAQRNYRPPSGAPPQARAVLDTLLYLIIVIGCQTMLWAQLARQREKRALTAEAKLVRTQLTALQLQLNPHFLFNALNGLNALIHDNPRLADELLGHLSELLRSVLASTDEPTMPLQRELDCLQHYLAIEKTRFHERLQFNFEIAPETLKAMVPTFVLQPLIENSIKHGIEPFRTKGTIHIYAKRTDKRLIITVVDNGKGLTPQYTNGKGIGLTNTQLRLEQLYPGDHAFSIENQQSEGCLVRIDIPYQESNQPASTTLA